MAKLQLNDNVIEFNEANYFNVKSLLPKLQRTFPLAEYDYQDLKINGEMVDLNSDHPDLVRPLDSVDNINIKISAKNNEKAGLLEELTVVTNKVLKKISECVGLLKENQTLKAKDQLLLIITAIEPFIEITSYLCKNSHQSESLPYKELQIHLLSVMKAISDAYAKSDLIMLTDLLEYELNDNLTQWKIHVFTNLRA